MLEKSQWIWSGEKAEADSYAEFYAGFAYDGGKVTAALASDSNYALYINGALAAFGQYACFEYAPVADEVNVTEFCHAGQNHFALVVWYYGADFSTYCPGKAGAIFALTVGNTALLCSSPAILSRRSLAYRSGAKKIITCQLGYSFAYDAAKEDGWKLGKGAGFSPSVAVSKPMAFQPRPNEKLALLGRTPSVALPSPAPGVLLFDLQREEVGFLELELTSGTPQRITVAYGEHLRDGRVAQVIDSRDFSVEYACRAGKNQYMNPFRRLGCRYLEVQAQQPVEVTYAGIRPTMYPFQRTAFLPEGALDRQIYEICVRTLALCYHEHYEDCPWREQSLYAMDSRNQMLCGYIAFGEFRAARASLLLFAQDQRPDGLLSICAPNAPGGCIPSFSLHYFTAVDEYLQYSGDLSLAEEIYPRLQRLLEPFCARMKDGLTQTFVGEHYWNFYEWSDGLSGSSNKVAESDLILNSLFALACKHMASISEKLGRPAQQYRALAARLPGAIHAAFYRPARGMFATRAEEHYSVLGNALAILAEAADAEEAARIAAVLAEDDSGLVPSTLSMNGFLFDALCSVDQPRYRPLILDKIRQLYGVMLKAGSTTVWEVETGAEAFDGAGSLCHGWSALPIYYYRKFANDKQE